MTYQTNSHDFREATRDARSILASAEKRCLIWIAERLPPWLGSDQLTALALASMALAGLSYWAAHFNRWWLFGVIAALALNWFGDSLDGTVARVRQQQRPRYGFYVDHVVDCFGVLFLLAGLGASGFMNPMIAMAVLVAYFMLSIEVFLATYCLAVFRLSFLGTGPTELRLLLAAGTLALLQDPHVSVFGRSLPLFDVGGLAAVALIGAVMVGSVVRNVRALYRAEPIPGRGPVKPDPKGPCLHPTLTRWLIFSAVGALGVVVQLSCVWILTAAFRLDYLIAVPIAVEAAIVHNFLWHDAWTWNDREVSWLETLRRFIRFNAANGAVSIAGNLAVTAALVQLTGMPYVAANAVAIAACSLVNFLVGDRVVFVATAVLAAVLAAPADARAAHLTAAAASAFERYTARVEARLQDERSGSAPFLWIDRMPASQAQDVKRRLRLREVFVSRFDQGDRSEFTDAMCHHWIATTFLPGVSIDRVVSLMQGYDDYARVYRPSVRQSRLLSRDGDRFDVFLQLFMKKIVSVVLNSESRVAYVPSGPSRLQVLSRSTRIAEVSHAGTSHEHEEADGADSGYLWRFNNYCAIDQREEGTFVQCESVSLTRDIPAGLGWLVGPFITSIPRDSLEFTLTAMRRSLETPPVSSRAR